MITRWTLSALAGDFDPAVQAEPLRSSRTWSASSWILCSVSSSAFSARAVRWAARVSRRVGFLVARSLRLVRLNQATIAPLLLEHAAGAAMPPTSARGWRIHAPRLCAPFTRGALFARWGGERVPSAFERDRDRALVAGRLGLVEHGGRHRRPADAGREDPAGGGVEPDGAAAGAQRAVAERAGVEHGAAGPEHDGVGRHLVPELGPHRPEHRPDEESSRLRRRAG